MSVGQNELRQTLYTGVALYLADGTTARKWLDIPFEQDDATFVYNLIKGSTFIEVNSMDIASGEGLYVIADQIVAFVLNP